jgi:hypothetical protein
MPYSSTTPISTKKREQIFHPLARAMRYMTAFESVLEMKNHQGIRLTCAAALFYRPYHIDVLAPASLTPVNSSLIRRTRPAKPHNLLEDENPICYR